MRKHKQKQHLYYFSIPLFLGLVLGPLNQSAWAADITTPITINVGDNKTINDNFTITSLGASKYALGTANGINSPTSITFNGNVNINITNPVSLLSLINTSNLYGQANPLDIKVKGSELNIQANVDNIGTNFDKFAAINLGTPTNLDVSAKTNIAITSTDASSAYATLGSGIANFNNDLNIAMSGGKYIYGLSSNYTLNGTNNQIHINTSKSERIAGIYNISSNTSNSVLPKIGANTNTSIRIIDTGTTTTQANGVGATLLAIGEHAVLNIHVDSLAQGRNNNYLSAENGTNGIMIQGTYLQNFPNEQFKVEKDAQLNIVVNGTAVDITPGMAPDTNITTNTGLGGATGISSSAKAIIDGNINIDVRSAKGVGIKVISHNPDAFNIYSGAMHFNGDTIVNAQGGYALLSATSSAGSRPAFEDRYNDWAKQSDIYINENGGRLVQLTGDIDHMDMFNSYFNINLDTADSFLRGSAMLSNVRQYHAGRPSDADGNKTDITLANGATWYMSGKSDLNLTGNSIVNNLAFASKGLLDMTASDTSSTYTYEQLNINALAGNDGRILMNTNLQQSFDNKNVKADSDRIYIEKYSNQYEIDNPNPRNPNPDKILSPLSAGIHTIDIKDTSLLTKIPAEGYLLLVEDHTKGNAKFVGGNLEKGGIFKYKPVITNEDPLGYSNIPTDATNWYLTGFAQNGIQEEVFINAGLAESRYISYMNEQDTLIKRLGELRQHDKEKGIWVRIRGANNSVDGYGINRNSYVSTHLGYDWKLKEKESSKAKRYMGVAINHTNNNFDYSAGATGKGQSNVLTVYGTRLGDKGHYLDLVGKIGRMSNNYKYQEQQVEANNWFYSLSAEYGRSIVRDKGWYYEPQVQFTFGHINGASYNSKESNVNADSINSAILRAGILAGRKFNEDIPEKNGSYYAKLFWNHEFAGDVKASMTDVYGDRFDFKHSYSGSWITVGLGTSLNLNKKTNLYLDVEKAFGGKVNGGWAWQGGVRWRF